MNIIEYANMIGVELTSTQMNVLELWEKSGVDETTLMVTFPRMSGRNLIHSIIQQYTGYLNGVKYAANKLRDILEIYEKDVETTRYVDIPGYCETVPMVLRTIDIDADVNSIIQDLIRVCTTSESIEENN